ncbi:DCC1-like thiol-disulfide oxidoreductase family protein [Methylobacterium sp. 88A]|uniref:thiol-disulfide oxidoreductase DCC family protein n=1 Tax=Methylobacterium sp. 88A TaxID=1131813 RepID=UPI0032AF7AAE
MTVRSSFSTGIVRSASAGSGSSCSVMTPNDSGSCRLSQHWDGLYAHYGLVTDRLETNILLCEGRAWFKLEGSIRIASRLGFPWSLAATLRLIPTRRQTALYDLIANSRFVLFGREDVCHRPARTDADRFLA